MVFENVFSDVNYQTWSMFSTKKVMITQRRGHQRDSVTLTDSGILDELQTGWCGVRIETEFRT